ncbi:MAG: RNA polymerase sigma-70 factor [Cyclobacteriaceae bacterium]
MMDALPGNDRRENLFSSEAAETRIIDAEVLLRKTFDHDPRQGCSLLFRLYYAPLCSHVIRFVFSRQVAEDIVADVFCRFWDGRVFEKISTSYRAYLFKSVRHRAYNYIKFQLSRRAPDEKFDVDGNGSDPCEILLYDELYQLVDNTINALPQQCKRVFVLSRMENKRYQEIAAELDISVKAIEAHISKALRILRKKVNGELV